MTRGPLSSLVLIVAGALLVMGAARPTPHKPTPYQLPPETPIALPPGAGADLTAATCAACHSLDYLTNQPRGKGAQFWKDSVAKMVGVYGAPIEKADAEIIADYLGRTFG